MKIGVIIIQVLFIHVFLYLGAALKLIIPISIPIPGSMFGLILLFLALCLNLVKLEWVEKGGNWLLAELLLFFIPSAVGIVNYDDILSLQGVEIVLLISISTIIVMGMTALIAERITGKRRGEAR